MYLIGIDPLSVGILKSIYRISQQRADKEYMLTGIETDRNDKLETVLSRLLQDRSLWIKNRVYSQDRRPSKMVWYPPRILLNQPAPYASPIPQLRRQKISLEGINLTDGSGYLKHPYGKGLGNDYQVSRKMLIDIFLTVLDTKRIQWEPDGAFSELLSQTIADARSGELSRWAPVVMLPIWFREVIPYTRSYRV